MSVSRRGFIKDGFGVTLFFLGGGCQTAKLFGNPNLTFGVISDIHLTTPESTATLERALRCFRDRDVDAVMVCGDITDWGIRSGLKYFNDTWNRVFPGGKGRNGVEVVKLATTGNHDFEGWRYGDMTMEMHANGYSEDDAIVKTGGMKSAWETAFNEPYDGIRVRTVKGYSFVSCEWDSIAKGSDFLTQNASRFKDGKPFFYFQHLPIQGTTPDSFGGWVDKGPTFKTLQEFPNAVAFTGHTHRPFYDERSVWQENFTAFAVPSLSYTSFPPGHENGGRARNGTATNVMPMIPSRRDFTDAAGYVVSVYDNKMVVERRDFRQGNAEECAPAWLVPLYATVGGSLSNQNREKLTPVPQFPENARLRLETRNTEDAQGKWAIVLTCVFPSAVVPKGSRVFDYEIRVVPSNGSKALVQRFLSPAYSLPPKLVPEFQRFWIKVNLLPQDTAYRIEVYPRNCFGVCGKPLVSQPRQVQPGLGKAK